MPSYLIRHLGVAHRLTSTETLIGRSEDCPIRIEHSKVSRIHAVFRVTSDGAELVDLGSMNGTRVNGQRILGPRRLRHGDSIQVGSELLEVEIDGDSAGPAAGAFFSRSTLPPTTEPFEDMAAALDTLEVVEAMLSSRELIERPEMTARTIRALLDNSLTIFAKEGGRLDRSTAERIARVAARVAERAPGQASAHWVDQVADRVRNLLDSAV